MLCVQSVKETRLQIWAHLPVPLTSIRSLAASLSSASASRSAEILGSTTYANSYGGHL